MLVCGQEEPIRANSQIYQMADSPAQMVLSDVEDDRLIIVGTLRMPTRELSAHGIIHGIKEGEEADEVWR